MVYKPTYNWGPHPVEVDALNHLCTTRAQNVDSPQKNIPKLCNFNAQQKGLEDQFFYTLFKLLYHIAYQFKKTESRTKRSCAFKKKSVW